MRSILSAATAAAVSCLVCFTAISPAGARPRAAARPVTEWLAHPTEAARIARVENGLPPLEVPGEAPAQLSLQQWMKLLQIPGLSVAVFDDFHLVWAKSYGVKEAGQPAPVELTTLFQAASISKPVTAIEVMRLVQAGKLDLDADVNSLLRAWKVPDNAFTQKEKVTLRRLLSHSAGTTVSGFDGYVPGQPVPTTLQILDGAVPANSGPVRVDQVPGTKERYSGGGLIVVQQLLTEQLGRPFAAALEADVLRPLGLTRATFAQPLPPARAGEAASGHDPAGHVIEGRWNIYPEEAAAGLWTTPTELARLAIEVALSKAGRSNRLLSAATTRLMLTQQSAPGENVGIGFFVEPGNDRFGHSGSNKGFKADLIAFADAGKGFAVMANSYNGSMLFNRLAQSLAREYGWTAFKPNRRRIDREMFMLARLKGTAAALAYYRQLRGSQPAILREDDLVDLGYQLLSGGQLDDAIAAFELGAELYPRYWNAHDSLGDAYFKAGRKEAAIASYRRALALDPSDDNAKKMLRSLGATP